MLDGGQWLAVAFYSAYGMFVIALLLWTWNKEPFIPFKFDDPDWTLHWLCDAMAEYYAACFSLCGIILATEPKIQGLIWVCFALVLGSPVSCAYVVYRTLQYSSLSLGDEAWGVHNLFHPHVFTAIYTIVPIAFVVFWIWTWAQAPLFLMQTDSPSWCGSWMILTLCNYYVMAMALCAIVLATESTGMALLWCIGILCPGSGSSPFYIVTRLFQFPTLELTASHFESMSKDNVVGYKSTDSA